MRGLLGHGLSKPSSNIRAKLNIINLSLCGLFNWAGCEQGSASEAVAQFQKALHLKSDDQLVLH